MTTAHPFGDPAELSALYAAGAMTVSERQAFEDHLDSGCAVCRAELAEQDVAVVALLESLPAGQPRPESREELLRRIAIEGRPSAGAVADARPWHNWETDCQVQELFVRRKSEGAWEDTGVAGVLVRRLFVDRDRDQMTALVRMSPCTSYPRHVHAAAEECLVLEGQLRVGDDVLRAGDYQRAAAGSRHGVQSTDTGCLLLIISSLSDELD